MLKRNNWFTKILYQGEKWIYKKADKLIFTMEGGKNYIIDKGWDKANGGPIDISKVYHVNNGVELDSFAYNRDNNKINDDDLTNEKTFKVVYEGYIGKVNNMSKIIEAAKYIDGTDNKNIRFLIYGDGIEKSDLEKYCDENKINNVVFKGRVDKEFIPYILSKANLNIFHFDQNSIKKYGASLNKMFEYFASGKPTFADCEFGYDLIKKYNCGIVVDNADVKQWADTIIQFSEMPDMEYEKYCNNALKAAKDYDFKELTKKLENIIGANN